MFILLVLLIPILILNDIANIYYFNDESFILYRYVYIKIEIWYFFMVFLRVKFEMLKESRRFY